MIASSSRTPASPIHQHHGYNSHAHPSIHHLFIFNSSLNRHTNPLTPIPPSTTPRTATMVLKRKRSDSEISTSSSLLSSPLSASGYMSIDYPASHTQIPTPSLFASRTRKRYRDNRPSESEVHRMPCLFLSPNCPPLMRSVEHTLSLLFSGAQKPQQAALPTSFRQSFNKPQEPVFSLPSSNQSGSSQQASLHSFWHGPMASGTRQSSPSSNYSNSSANTPSSASQMTSFFPATNCEDCDASLGQSDDADAMDVDMIMDIDMGGAGSHACTACGKQVCHSCAVSNLGAERKCLHCAGRSRVTQGGGAFGWVRAC